MDFLDVIGGIILGLWMRETSRMFFSMFRKKKSPEPEPRAVGDLVCSTEVGLPVLLLKQLSFDKFEACYITPHCGDLGAEIDDKALKPCEEFLALKVQDRLFWKDYTAPLSDAEHANYAKAMLTDE